jgi:predicted aspartyl protease
MVSATRVMIDTLEIDGWVEHDIPALVMDIPGQPGMGLLGLNYLKHFKMNLNNEQGSLLLTPR